jgi:DNA/RNA-binding domain of Phe-tRNA-synthetase-like protein
MSHAFVVEESMFQALPKLSVLIAVVRNIDLNKIDKDGIKKYLTASWNSARQQIEAYPNVQSHPNIQLWREAFSALKVSTKKYTTSVESMVKRAAKPDSKPFFINPLVDFYNAFSLKYLIPFGGFDMESDVSKNMHLRFSKEGDKFLALDADVPIDVPVGEALYASGNTVITRHINWKQSKEGLIQDSSVNVCFMAEVLNGYPEAQLADLQADLKKSCIELLQSEAEIYLATEANPSLTY